MHMVRLVLLVNERYVDYVKDERVGWIKRIVIMAYYVVGAIDWWCARLISLQRDIFAITRFLPCIVASLHRCIVEYERALIMQKDGCR